MSIYSGIHLNGWIGKQRGIAGGVGVEFAF